MRFPRLLLSLASVSAIALSLASPASAKELDANAIVNEALAQGSMGFQQGTATLDMTIVKKSGDKKVRTLEVKALRDKDGLLSSLIKFSKPAEVAGTAFLVKEKKGQLPDQYVYVPAARVVRRVAAGNATSSFFGSDFTFADLMPLPESDRDKVALKRLPDAEISGQKVHVIEVTPKVDGSPYGKLVLYVMQKQKLPLKIEFFDPAKKPLKTLVVKKLKKIKKPKPALLPIQVEMRNLQTGSKTIIDIRDPNPNAKLTKGDFTEEAMTR